VAGAVRTRHRSSGAWISVATADAFRVIDTVMRSAGYAPRVRDTGWYNCAPSGARTEAAVRVFQEQHGLKVDGVVDATTWAVLLAA
jgi:peptidoglycan hydrolase-like protein with peptidoglycan-binding domain